MDIHLRPTSVYSRHGGIRREESARQAVLREDRARIRSVHKICRDCRICRVCSLGSNVSRTAESGGRSTAISVISNTFCMGVHGCRRVKVQSPKFLERAGGIARGNLRQGAKSRWFRENQGKSRQIKPPRAVNFSRALSHSETILRNPLFQMVPPERAPQVRIYRTGTEAHKLLGFDSMTLNYGGACIAELMSILIPTGGPS